ncbi:hypothetical protein LJ737_09835 [Hymenobacter sp. 15J16-1T3B]|nr:hypothetical protein [Hymenobacter sp. 15J16-1T3B]
MALIHEGLNAQPRAAARHQYCWTQAAALMDALLTDIEAVTQQRSYITDCRLSLNPRGSFGSGTWFLVVKFDPQDPFSVRCYCHFGPENRIQLQVLDEAESRALQRAAKLLAGPAYDNGWTELNTLLR